MLDFTNQGCIDVGEQHGPIIYKVMKHLSLTRLWEALKSANESTQHVTRDEFTKVFLSWLSIDEQFELAAVNQGVPLCSLHQCRLIIEQSDVEMSHMT
jgi:hypothetical protein